DVAHSLRHLGEEADLYVSSRAFGVRHLLEELVEGLAPGFGLASRFGGCVVEPCLGHGGVVVLEAEERADFGAANPELYLGELIRCFAEVDEHPVRSAADELEGRAPPRARR